MTERENEGRGGKWINNLRKGHKQEEGNRERRRKWRQELGCL